MKLYLLSACILLPTLAMAESANEACMADSKIESCNTCLAFFEQEGVEITPPRLAKKEKDSFLSRALEQRIGERYRRMKLDEKQLQVQ